MSVWRPASRMARRSIRRSLGRSVLIAMLIGLPVAVATFADVLHRSSDSPATYTHQRIGSADAKVVVTSADRLRDVGTPSEYYGGWAYEGERDPASVDVQSLLPPGTTTEVVDAGGQTLLLRHGDRYAETYLETAVMPSVFRPDRLELRDGRLPTVGQVAVSQRTADRLGAASGDTVSDELTGTTIEISGIVRDQQCLRCDGVYAQPGQVVAPTDDASARSFEGLTEPSYLVDLPAGTDAFALARELAEVGVAVYPRDTYVHRDDYEPSYGWDSSLTLDQVRAAALTTLIVGLGLLEVVLLAGAAFAVGARRQVRDMGLINAGGASPAQLRTVLLVQGATLGVLGTIGGVAVGLLVARLGWPLWEWLNGATIPVFRFGPEILIAVVVGVVSGVLAALVPAIGAARMQPLDALSARFRVTRARSRRVALVGVAGIVAGVALGLVGSAQMAEEFDEYAAVLATAQQTGVSLASPSPTLPVALILTGAVLAVAGLVLAMPLLLGVLGRVGARLPLSGRLAVRDADRHRHRTGPAASAIMLAVAGSVVAAFAVAGSAAADEATWVPSLPPNTLEVHPTYEPDEDEQVAIVADGARRAAGMLPGATVLEPSTLGYETSASQQEQGMSSHSPVWFETHSSCTSSCMTWGVSGGAAVADPTLVHLALGRELTAEETAALERGEVLAPPALVDGAGMATAYLDGQVEVLPDGSYAEYDEDEHRLRLPALAVDRDQVYGSMPSVFMTPETAARHGLEVLPATTRLVAFDDDATATQVRAARAAVAEEHRANAYVQRPYASDDQVALLAVAGVAALVTLIGVGIAVALSAAEGRRELATLSAVGAPPRIRRRLASMQALILSGVGGLVGVALGVFVSYALRATFGAPEFTVPWANLAIVALGVPLVAAVLAAACTRSAVPLLERRG